MKHTNKKFAVRCVSLLFAAAAILSCFTGCSGTGVTISGSTEYIGKYKPSDFQNAAGRYVMLDYPEYDVLSCVELGDYHSIKIPKTELQKVTEDEIDIYVAMYLSNLGKFLDSADGIIHKGDWIVVTYTAYRDGLAVQSYKTKDASFLLGGSGEPEDFVKGLDGAKVDEELEFNVTFPSDWEDSSVANETLLFKARVSSVKVMPELTDEFISEVSDGEYETVVSLRDHIRSILEEEYETTYKNTVSSNIMSVLSTIVTRKTPPEDFVKWYVSMSMVGYQFDADVNNMSLEEYLIENGIANSEQAAIDMAAQSAAQGVSATEVLAAIAVNENITIDLEKDAELIQAHRDELVEGLGCVDERTMLMYYKDSNVIHDMLVYRVLDWLIDNTEQVDGLIVDGQ